MIISVGHGNKQIKPLLKVFTSGLVSMGKQPFEDDILFYQGKYYPLTSYVEMILF